jgi:hypothetical protein
MDELILIALASKKILTFTYHKLDRICEPHVFGIANGRKQLLCYQTGGRSSRGGIPQWRRFDLGEIQSLVATAEAFDGKRRVPHPFSIWDSVISVVS